MSKLSLNSENDRIEETFALPRPPFILQYNGVEFPVTNMLN